MYAITGTIVHHTKNSQCVSCDVTIQIPTFYLDPDVQGIVSEAHAVKIARSIVMPVELEYESVTVNLHATNLSVPTSEVQKVIDQLSAKAEANNIDVLELLELFDVKWDELDPQDKSVSGIISRAILKDGDDAEWIDDSLNHIIEAKKV